MDWGKTKTIFIIVFSIVNIFLYSLYVNQQDQVKNVEVLGSVSVAETLKLDNITYDTLPQGEFDSSYISANIVKFTEEIISSLKGQTPTIENETTLRSSLEKPYAIFNTAGNLHQVEEFLEKYVYWGEQYIVWEVDKENHTVTLFQQVFDEPIYYSPSAQLKLYFNRDGEVYRYEQRMLDAFVSFNRKKDLVTPFEAISSLSTRGKLRPNSTIKQVKLGYSTLVQFTENQVFAPTWQVEVELEDGTIENYFVNAIEGKVVDLKQEKSIEE